MAWVGVFLIWLSVTPGYHANLPIAALSTGALVAGYATAVHANHRWLIPDVLNRGRPWRYGILLAVTMLVCTALALAVIASAYAWLEGALPTMARLRYHYRIDLVLMVFHVAGAAAVARLYRAWQPAAAEERRR